MLLCYHEHPILFDSLTLSRMEGSTSTRGPQGLQKPTWLSPPTKATAADNLELLFHGTALKHMETRPNSQVGHTCFNCLVKNVKIMTLNLLWTCFWVSVLPLIVFMTDQPLDDAGRGGSSSGQGMGQSILAACSATMCCCCLWNMLSQYLWVAGQPKTKFALHQMKPTVYNRMKSCLVDQDDCLSFGMCFNIVRRAGWSSSIK